MTTTNKHSVDPLLTEPYSSTMEIESIHEKRDVLFLKRQWIQTSRQILSDVQSTDWKRTCGWFLFFLWAAGVVMVAVLFPIFATTNASFRDWSYCAPDGSFSYGPVDVWSPKWFFQISLAYGSLSFTEAKIIDILWDVGIGRIGQVFLVYMSFKAFSVHVRASMESEPVSYTTFWTIFMQREATFTSLRRTISDFAWKRGLKSRVAMCFIVATMIFVLLFPTLASAMTGYTSNTDALVMDFDGNYVDFGKFAQVYAIVHDGWRVNATGNYPVVSRYATSAENTCGDDCLTMNGVSLYVSKYPHDGVSMNETVWGDVPLDPPVLNITLYLYNENIPIFSYANRTYNMAYLFANGTCQASGTYQWGFSALQLLITMLLLVFWTFGVYAMGLKAHLSLKQKGSYEVPGHYRAALYLADAIHQEFKEMDEKPEALTNSQLQKRVEREIFGGSVEIVSSSAPPSYDLWKGFACWVRASPWKFALLLSLTLFVGSIWIFHDSPPVAIPYWGLVSLYIGFVFSLIARWSVRSQATVGMCCLLIGSLIPLIVFQTRGPL